MRAKLNLRALVALEKFPYWFALLTTAVAILLRWLLDPWLGDNLPFVTFFLAVAVTARVSGWRPALLATFLGFLAVFYLFQPPRFFLLGLSGSDSATLAIYFSVNLLLVLLIGGLRTAELALERSEREFRDLFDNAPVGIHWVGADGNILQVNQAELDLLGYERTEMVGRPVAEFHLSGTAIADILYRLGAGETLHDYPAQLRCKDGRSKEVLIDSNALWRDGHFVHSRCFTRDVTAHKHAEDALRESEERFRQLANNIHQLVWTCDELGYATWYNQRWYEYTGKTFDQTKGEGWRELQHPAHVQRVASGLEQALRSGQAWEDTFPLRAKDGEYRWFLSRAQPIKDTDGKVIRWFGTNTDVTELRLLQEALYQADRRKDEFLATLAHELRNPLAPIRNSLEVMKRAEGDATQLQNSRDTIDRQVKVMERLIEDLLDVSRITRNRLELRLEPVELGVIVRQAVEAIQPLAVCSRQSVELLLPPAPLYLQGDPVRLVQIIGNLLSNACKYTPAGGKIQVTLERQGREARVLVRDNGMGIAPELLPRIFDIFVQLDQSLERQYGGLGIGLTLVKQLTELHQGASGSPQRRPRRRQRIPGISAAAPRNTRVREGTSRDH